MNKSVLFIIILLILITVCLSFVTYLNKQPAKKSSAIVKNSKINPNPLSIELLRQKEYPGSEIIIEQTLPSGNNYQRYIASYKSEGLKIYALLTVPNGEKPKNGLPVIIFNHGYIPPQQYQTTQRYVNYVDTLARNGYMVFKPDYRGHGNSEGMPEGAYYSPAYAVDVLNAVSSIKKFKDADSEKIGMWGHSMGGNITLRDIVVDTKDIKAVVIWSGVVGNYDDLINNWQRRVSYRPSSSQLALRNRYRESLIKQYGTPQANPAFWDSIDPVYFLSDITTPMQLHTGGADEEVPINFSQALYEKLKNLGKTVEYFNYAEGDHNISSPYFELAMTRSVDFFDKYLKGGGV